jgi:hypothetical protein
MQVLTEERPTLSTKNKILARVIVAGLFTIGAVMKTANAAAQSASAALQPVSAAAPLTPQSPKVVVGKIEAKKLLLLMDADKNGKVSRAEFMAFTAVEFDRLDTIKDGELDVKELERTQLIVVHHGGGHREKLKIWRS